MKLINAKASWLAAASSSSTSIQFNAIYHNLFTLIAQLGEPISTFILHSTKSLSSTNTSLTEIETCISPMINFTLGLIVMLLLTWFILFPLMHSTTTHAFRLLPSFPNSHVQKAYQKRGESKNTQKDQEEKSKNHSILTPSSRGNNNSTTSSNNHPILIPTTQSPLGGFKNVLNEVSSMFEERSTQVKKALEEFSQPFVGFTRNESDVYDDDEDGNEYYNDNNDNSPMEMTIIVEGSTCKDCKSTANDVNEDVPKKQLNNDHTEKEQVTHFCFLVHGYRGKPADLLYLRSAMADTAEKIFANNNHCKSTVSTTSKGESIDKQQDLQQDQQRDENDDTSGKDRTNNPQTPMQKHRIVLHSCDSNWNRTSDGVEAGGERIFNEILTVIRTSMQNCISSSSTYDNEIIDVTMSLIGNSLGGLYSRYAIAKLAEFAKVQQEQNTNQRSTSRHSDDSNDETSTTIATSQKTFLIDGKIRIHFNIFCTTATPHLGVSGQTYFPLPRSAELGIGSLMGQTGRDIFRMSPLIKTMCTTDAYLQPLSSFQKRIAYANGYHTDFVVSTQTAAFLHPESTIPHRVSSEQEDGVRSGGVEGWKNDDGSGKRSNGGGGGGERENENHVDNMVAATLYTQALGDIPTAASVEDSNTASSVKEELLEMSAALDQLGWKKVIVDLRNEMPMKLPVPKRPRILPRIVKKWNRDAVVLESQVEGDTTNVKEEESGETQFGSEVVPSSDDETNPSPTKILESRDVANAYSIPDDFIGFPLGHNTMVAVAQSRFTFVFKGGRPLMDKLAVEMIDEILNYDIQV